MLKYEKYSYIILLYGIGCTKNISLNIKLLAGEECG